MLVLQIDSDRDACRLLRDILAHAGHHVVAATTVEEALEIVRGQAPAVIVTEYEAPRGQPVLELLRRADLTRSIPVLVWSASVLPEVRDEVASSGAWFLPKPTPMDELAGAISAIVAHNARG